MVQYWKNYCQVAFLLFSKWLSVSKLLSKWLSLCIMTVVKMVVSLFYNRLQYGCLFVS